MVEIRTVRESELDAFRRLHEVYVDRDESVETLRDRHRARPELFVAAYDDGELVGGCLGDPRSDETVELAGIAVERSHQCRGIGAALLSTFEDRAASLGFRRITLGSAGGYVDEFYVENGYRPDSVLVRLDAADTPENDRIRGYEIVDERTDGPTRKLYVNVDRFDPAFLDEVRDAFDDPDAVYVMSKTLDTEYTYTPGQ